MPAFFAPLNPALRNAAGASNAPKLRGIVFDMDGTLSEPQTWMFAQMRSALGIEKGVDILEHIEAQPAEDRHRCEEAIRDVEREAMVHMRAQPGLVALMEYLDSRSIRKAICTRNFDGPTQHLMNTFLPGIEMDPIVTRKFKPAKPHPAGIHHIADNWGMSTDDMIMVGDSIDDMTAGRRAGTKTVLLLSREGHNSYLVGGEFTDVAINRLDDLIQLLEDGTLGEPGNGGPE